MPASTRMPASMKTKALAKGAFFLPLLALPVLAQVSHPVVDTVVAAPSNSSSLPDHKIVPNDLLAINVFDEPELSKPAIRVSEDGTLVLPLLTRRFKVEGLMPRELEAEIAADLIDEQVLVHPIVTVSITEYATRQISFGGDVKIPGQFNITGPTTLLEAMAKVGWVTTDAGSVLFFSKSSTDAPRTISLDDLQQKSTDPSINVTLTGGEVINVPDAPKVWVTGNVTKPGPVPFKRPADATVLKVVASSQGLTQYYAKNAYIYRTDPVDGQRHEIPIRLKDIMHRKVQDVPLLSDDILLIPDDNGYLRRQILSELQTLSGGAASAAIYLGIQRQ